MTTTTTERATLTTADGRSFDIPTHWNDRNPEHLWGLDSCGNPMARLVDEGVNGEFEMVYGLTDCCGASFKGMDDGIGCRACCGMADGSDMPIGAVSQFVSLAVAV